MGFLPTGYEPPKNGGSYMKLADGKNKFRVLGSAIVGYEWWTEVEGKRSPSRSKTLQEAVEKGVEPLKHFWAFPVWNYQTEAIEVLELTQKTIMAAITQLVSDDEWGDPKEYDITVTRTGKELDTKYSVTPSPKREIDPVVTVVFQEMKINLDALFVGGDPFRKEE